MNNWRYFQLILRPIHATHSWVTALLKEYICITSSIRPSTHLPTLRAVDDTLHSRLWDVALDAGLAVCVQAGEDLWLRKPIQTNGTSQFLLDTLRQTRPLRHFVEAARAGSGWGQCIPAAALPGARRPPAVVTCTLQSPRARSSIAVVISSHR